MSIPPATELAAACRGLIRAWHAREPALDWDVVTASFGAAGSTWPDAVGRLCIINCFQWHLEDECRAHYEESDRLARLKREIDASNARRVRCIDALDERLVAELGVSGDGTSPVAVMTPGNLLDRITILELKRAHVTERPALAALLDEQIDDACRGLDRLLEDLACARQRMKRYGTVKLFPGAG